MEARNALLGYTGFVGRNLLASESFEVLVNRANLSILRGASVGRLVCSAAPAEKWRANQDPAGDRANLEKLVKVLRTIEANHITLISTVDVYPDGQGDETTIIDPSELAPYGRNRLWLEEVVRANFPQHLVVRLPALFGPGLKKNLAFDLLHGRREQFTDHRSSFQFYDVSELSALLAHLEPSVVSLFNVATEPVTAATVAERVFGADYRHVSRAGPVSYDAHTRHASVVGRDGPYMRTAEETLAAMEAWVRHEKALMA